MYVARIFVNEGATYKRVMPRARGNANEIQKKTCHIDLVLAEKGEKVGMPVRGDTKVKRSAEPQKIKKEERSETVKEEKAVKAEKKETKKTPKKTEKKIAKKSTKE
jgi:hypothetical protein